MGGFFALAFEVINFQNQLQFTGQPLLVYYSEHSYPNSPSIWAHSYTHHGLPMNLPVKLGILRPFLHSKFSK